MAFTCPRCGMTSHHPEDERQGYCGNCHDWTAGLRHDDACEGRLFSPVRLDGGEQVNAVTVEPSWPGATRDG